MATAPWAGFDSVYATKQDRVGREFLNKRRRGAVEIDEQTNTMKTLLLALVAAAGLGFTAPNAEARDHHDKHHHRHYSDRYDRYDYYRSHRRPVVVYRGQPRYGYYGPGYYYTSRYSSPRYYYRNPGITFLFRF